MRLRRGLLSEQLAQTSGTGLLQGGAQCHLHGFQVQCASLATRGEDHSQQRIYFPRDFLYGTMCMRDYLIWKENNHAFEEASLFRSMRMDIGGLFGGRTQSS